jgi:hypothetical protein
MVLKIFLQNLTGTIKVARFGELVRTRQNLGSCLSLSQGIKGNEHKAKKARPHPDRKIANFMDPI